jgi:formate dehydrogenase subunit gamma
VPGWAVPPIASELNVSRAKVQGVLDFYHNFRRAPPGRHLARICRAESCQAMGSASIEARAREVLGTDYRETTPDGALTLMPFYCLGNCAGSPAVRVDDEILGRMDPDGFAELLRTLHAEAPAP